MKTFLAIDISVERMKIFLGTVGEFGVELEEVSFFSNRPVLFFGHSCWNITDMFFQIVETLKRLRERGTKLDSIGVSAMGFDMCCFGADGLMLSLPFAHPDFRRNTEPERLFARYPRQKLYEANAVQISKECSLLQLDALRRMGNTALSVADKVLFLSDAIIYMLTGQMVTNRIQASAGGLLNVATGMFDPNVLRSVGLTEQQFGPLTDTGMIVGHLSDSVCRLTGLGRVPVVVVPGFGKVSAITALPSASINSGSVIMGDISFLALNTSKPIVNSRMALFEFGNQIGAGSALYLTKILRGTSLLRRVLREWNLRLHDDDVMMMTMAANVRNVVFNTEDAMFDNPASLEKTIRLYCETTGQQQPESRADILRCIYHSVANCFSEQFSLLADASGIRPTEYHIAGSVPGSTFFCQLLANSLGQRVFYGPSEPAAVGSVMVQAVQAGIFSNLEEARALERRSADLTTFEPHGV